MSATNYFGLAAALKHLSSCAARAATYADEVAAHVDVYPDNSLHAPRRDDLASGLRTLGAAIDTTNLILAVTAKNEEVEV